MVAPSIQLTHESRRALRAAAADMLRETNDGAAIGRLVDEVLRVAATHYHYKAGPVCPACFMRSHKRSKVLPVLMSPDDYTPDELIHAIRRSTSLRDTALIIDLLSHLRRSLVRRDEVAKVRIEALKVLAKFPHERLARATISFDACHDMNPSVRRAAFRLLEDLGVPGAVRSALDAHPGLRRYVTRDWPWSDEDWTALVQSQTRWPERHEGPQRSPAALQGLKCATCPNRTLRERWGHDWARKPKQKQDT